MLRKTVADWQHSEMLLNNLNRPSWKASQATRNKNNHLYPLRINIADIHQMPIYRSPLYMIDRVHQF